MTQVDLILQERHEAQLKGLLCRPDGAEAAAYMLMGMSDTSADPWSGHGRVPGPISYEVIPVPDADAISAGPAHVTWSTASFVRLAKRAGDEEPRPSRSCSNAPARPGRVLGSRTIVNERELHRLVTNRDGPDVAHGEPPAPLWWRPLAGAAVGGSRRAASEADRVMVVGRRLSVQREDGAKVVDEVLDRQVGAFGAGASA